jgi:hypothetical protein
MLRRQGAIHGRFQDLAWTLDLAPAPQRGKLWGSASCKHRARTRGLTTLLPQSSKLLTKAKLVTFNKTGDNRSEHQNPKSP